MAEVISIWAYESDADVLHAWRKLSPSDREEQDIYWRRAIQRRVDAIDRGNGHAERIARLEHWQLRVTAVLFALGVGGGSALTAFAIIDRISG